MSKTTHRRVEYYLRAAQYLQVDKYLPRWEWDLYPPHPAIAQVSPLITQLLLISINPAKATLERFLTIMTPMAVFLNLKTNLFPV